MKTIAIIPAKADSRRLPAKNLQPFSGLSLLAHKIRQLNNVEQIDAVIVGTDSDAIAAVAIDEGAEVRVQDPYHSSDACPIRERWRNLIAMTEAELVVWAHCTNPLTRAEDYHFAIEAYHRAAECGFDSLASVTPIQRHAWRIDDTTGRGAPINFDPQALPYPYAADLDPMYVQDGAIFIQPHRAMLENGFFYGNNPYLWVNEYPRGLDIDTADDLNIARRLYAGGFR